MRHKLLLADGSVTIQRVVALTFAHEDVDVKAVDDGEQAVAAVKADRPDIILAEIAMPKLDGYGVATFIKQDPTLAHIPVLLLTGALESIDEERGRRAGCDGILVKPFEPQQVVARVQELLRGARGSASRATADVPRPVERLLTTGPRPEPVERLLATGPRPGPSTQLFSGPPPLGTPAPDVQRAGTTAVPEGEDQARKAASTTAFPPAGALDDYFDQLDAAFRARADTMGGATLLEAAHGLLSETDVESMEHAESASSTAMQEWAASGDAQGLAAASTVMAAGSGADRAGRKQGPDVSQRSVRSSEADDRSKTGAVADAFSALLAVEEGTPDAAPVRWSVSEAPVEARDEETEHVVKSVLSQIDLSAVRDAMSGVVTAVAEQLVREEIKRARARAVADPEAPHPRS